VHPWYNFFGACISSQPISLGDVFYGSLFTLLVMGVVTLPAGVFAALCCLFVGNAVHMIAASVAHFRQK